MVGREGGGPSPFRDAQYLWGLSGLTRKQLLQLWVGSFLCKSVVRLFVELVKSGGQRCLSIRLSPHGGLGVRFRGTCRSCSYSHGTQQCLISSLTSRSMVRGQKPTGLMTLRLGKLEGLLRDTGGRGKCRHPLGHPMLKGLDAENKRLLRQTLPK